MQWNFLSKFMCKKYKISQVRGGQKLIILKINFVAGWYIFYLFSNPFASEKAA